MAQTGGPASQSSRPAANGERAQGEQLDVATLRSAGAARCRHPQTCLPAQLARHRPIGPGRSVPGDRGRATRASSGSAPSTLCRCSPTPLLVIFTSMLLPAAAVAEATDEQLSLLVAVTVHVSSVAPVVLSMTDTTPVSVPLKVAFVSA